MPRILLADADRQLTELIGGYLVAQGHQVLYAEDGDQALERMQEAPIELLLLEPDLPKRDGLDVCRHMAGLPALAQIPVVFLADQSRTDDFERIRQVPNFAGFFTKPYTTMDVLRHIEKVLKGSLPS